VLDLGAVTRRVDTTLNVERTALLLLAGAVALAGGLLVAQALVRSAATIGDDALVLRAVGMTRGELATAAALSHAPTIAVAAAAALVTAVLASYLAPVGLGRKIDPDVGFHADWVVLASGVVLTVALLLAATLVIARGASSLRHATGSPRPSRMLAAIRRRAPLTIGLGTSIALERGSGRNKVPVLPALLGAVVGVLGVVGTMTIDRGINDSLAHPERAGVVADVELYTLSSSGDREAQLDQLSAVRAASPEGSVVAMVDRAVVAVNGVGAPTFAVRQADSGGQTPISLAVTSGRAPSTDGEAAIGPKTASDIGVAVGDTVEVGESASKVRIVGTALFPQDVHAEFDEGIWLTPQVFDAIVDPEGVERRVVVRLPDDADVDAAIGSIGDRLAGKIAFVGRPEVPPELTNLRNIRTLPLVLAGFLALLAVAALSHVLLTSARRRRRDFAVLRAIGFNRRGTRLVLNAQGTAIGIVGLVLGVPLGVALGRIGWRLVSDQVPLANVPPFAFLVVVLIVPATVLLTNALAVWPGRRVARLRPAEVLRTE
jgi:ABC-type lipoprotein release transport system permease subunit